MRLRIAVLTLFVLLPLKSLLAGSETTDRLRDAATVLREVMQTPDKAIPQETL